MFYKIVISLLTIVSLFSCRKDENIQLSNVEVFPNPFDEKFTINIIKNIPVEINIYNKQGKQIFILNTFSSTTAKIDLSEHKNDIYFLSIKGDGIDYFKPIIKNN